MTGTDGHTARWAIEGDAPYALTTRGWRKDLIVPGMRIEVNGYEAKRRGFTTCGRALILADGRTLVMSSCT
jgi:hypothetical protein